MMGELVAQVIVAVLAITGIGIIGSELRSAFAAGRSTGLRCIGSMLVRFVLTAAILHLAGVVG